MAFELHERGRHWEGLEHGEELEMEEDPETTLREVQHRKRAGSADPRQRRLWLELPGGEDS